MFNYYLFGEKVVNPYVGEYETFGIAVLDENGNELLKVSDVSAKEDDARMVVDLCNKEQLEPIHLQDVIEDVLYS